MQNMPSILVFVTDFWLVIDFMEAPMAPANEAMEAWAKAIRDRG